MTGTELPAVGTAMEAPPIAGSIRLTRWVAAAAGLVAFVLAVATPLLPVVQTTAMLNWPQHGQLGSVTSPLIALTPIDVHATVPCAVVRDMPADGGVIFGTAPKDGKNAALEGLFVTVSSDRVDVTDRNVVMATAPRHLVEGPACHNIEISATHDGTWAIFRGLHGYGSSWPDPNLRPQIVGVFSDLTGPAPRGLTFSATIDTRFTSRPTPLKLFAIWGAVAATAVALLALWRLDRLDSRRMRRWIPLRWRFFTATDVAVVFTFLLWYVIGANSSDDGYILAMVRVAGHATYMSNYFRWFGSPEDPFGWYYNLLALMTHVSDASIWMRLPDLVAGLACWLLLSREVLPRLGPAVVGSRAAMWAAGTVLLAAWMPFNNGLRPEGIIALGSLVTYVLIERAMNTGRLTPFALAILTAAFTLGIQPTGLIAVAALVAGGRPILRILVRRHRQVGTWPLVAPMLAAGTVILGVVFADQTLRAVAEATRVRDAVGPSQAWYTENLRYFYMLLPTVDGSLSRRFGFLITALCLFTAMFIMLRRKRVPGVARGPAWRLMGVILATIFFLMFTPTKWVHHMGLFAAVGGAVAALATVLVSPHVLRWSRNRTAFAAAVTFIMALTWAGTNGWWYVSSFGVPFNSSTPRIGPVPVSVVFVVLFLAVLAYAAWLHFAPRDRQEGRLGGLLTAAPVPVAAGFMVLVSIASMVTGIVRQYPSYSNGLANVRSLFGGCGLADNVLVEPDPNDGFMEPLPGEYGPLGPLGGPGPAGFSADGVPKRILAESLWVIQNKPGTDYDWDAPRKLKTPGINGSTVPLPYGLDPGRVPVAGSYVSGPQRPSRLTSAWYRLPAADNAAQPLLVVTAAGTIDGVSVRYGHTDGQKVVLEYGLPGAAPGEVVPVGRVSPYDLFGEQPHVWRNLRYPRTAIPADAVAVRVVAEDLSLTPRDWIAVTPPRVPQLRTVQEYIGSEQPVLLDWAVGLAFPCQQPMLHVNGVTEIPNYRITPDYNAKKQDTDSWQDGFNGGLLGITDLLLRAHVMATYLDRDWGRDWGSLRRFERIDGGAQPAELELGSAVRSGWWSPGKIRIKA